MTSVLPHRLPCSISLSLSDGHGYGMVHQVVCSRPVYILQPQKNKKTKKSRRKSGGNEKNEGRKVKKLPLAEKSPKTKQKTSNIDKRQSVVTSLHFKNEKRNRCCLPLFIIASRGGSTPCHNKSKRHSNPNDWFTSIVSYCFVSFVVTYLPPHEVRGRRVAPRGADPHHYTIDLE